MKRFVEFKLEDGSAIIFEANETETRGTTRASRHPGEITEEAKETFEQILSKVCHATGKLITTPRGLVHWPDEIKMEDGIWFWSDCGSRVVIDSASTQVGYKVALRAER